MEESLDKIANGETDRLKYLEKFYNGKGGLAKKVEEQDKKIKPEESRTVDVERDGEILSIKVGRFGPYVVQKGGKDGKDEVHASIPEEIAPADLKPEDIKDLLEQSKNGPTPIGTDPKTKMHIYCLVGRYGAYLQLGEKSEDKEAPPPRRASLPKGMDPKTMDMAVALKLLSLPRELGVHPETKKPVMANNGRFGPYVVHDGVFRSLKKEDDLYGIELARALELLNEEKKGPRGGSKLIRDFGLIAKLKKKAAIYEGKYGPYIKVGTKNITLPEEKRDPKLIQTMTENELASIVLASRKK
jgi:DNA topoisomerase-1